MKDNFLSSNFDTNMFLIWESHSSCVEKPQREILFYPDRQGNWYLGQNASRRHACLFGGFVFSNCF